MNMGSFHHGLDNGESNNIPGIGIGISMLSILEWYGSSVVLLG